jgi:hypothetical protein
MSTYCDSESFKKCICFQKCTYVLKCGHFNRDYRPFSRQVIVASVAHKRRQERQAIAYFSKDCTFLNNLDVHLFEVQMCCF